MISSRFQGAVFGGAIGDALGAPYEGLPGTAIPSRQLSQLQFDEFEGYPRGQFTDDTQLTIATIQAIVESRHIDVPNIAAHIGELWRTAAVIGPGPNRSPK